MDNHKVGAHLIAILRIALHLKATNIPNITASIEDAIVQKINAFATDTIQQVAKSTSPADQTSLVEDDQSLVQFLTLAIYSTIGRADMDFRITPSAYVHMNSRVRDPNAMSRLLNSLPSGVFNLASLTWNTHRDLDSLVDPNIKLHLRCR